MKAGTSTLNPFAESYVPLSKRGIPDERRNLKSSGNESKSSNDANVGHQHWNPTAQAPQSYNFDSFDPADNSKLKGDVALGYPCSSSYYPAEMSEKQVTDDELEMDLAYLQVTFPGISDESLSDVYIVNKHDLDATVDMLNHLELPDTLDIGDVPEQAAKSELAS